MLGGLYRVRAGMMRVEVVRMLARESKSESRFGRVDVLLII